jgi:hypothetical protein
MWILYSLSGIFATGMLFDRLRLLYKNLYPTKYKTFEDISEPEDDDEYYIICYRIKLEDGSEIVETDLTQDYLKKIEEKTMINYITIEYMFNGQFMKYITYKKDIQFPIYKFKIAPTKYPYYPEIIFLNDVNITNYITPYLGPLCNFYQDREEPIKLKDALRDHPNYENLNFDEGILIMISCDTPINGKKCLIKKLPCNLIWKRHAAVDPKDDDKLN